MDIEYLLFKSYFAGILWILFGIYNINSVIKNPSNAPYDTQGGNMKGWVAGIGSILLGVVIIIYKIIN